MSLLIYFRDKNLKSKKMLSICDNNNTLVSILLKKKIK